MSELTNFQDTVLFRLHQTLDAVLPHPTGNALELLYQALRYTTFSHGKALRPMLVYATGLSFNANLEQLDHAAAAAELIHAYSLIHDDLPAMDNADLRRGKASCHKAFDEATAILSGDALQAVAFNVLAQQPFASDKKCLAMIKALSYAAFAMVEGQMLDVHACNSNMDLQLLEKMHQGKTGALITASIKLGAIAANCTDIELKILENFGEHIGLAFQIQDDLLDIESCTKKLGKPAANDEQQQRITYPKLLGKQQSKEKLIDTFEQANMALDKLACDTELLRSISNFVINRDR